MLAAGSDFWVETGTGWLPQVFAAALLGVAPRRPWLPTYAVVAALRVILLALAVDLSRGRTDTSVTAAP